jgi:hypothetical protein
MVSELSVHHGRKKGTDNKEIERERERERERETLSVVIRFNNWKHKSGDTPTLRCTHQRTSGYS